MGEPPPTPLGVAPGHVWVTSFDEALVIALDPRTGAENGRFSLPAEAGQMAVSD